MGLEPKYAKMLMSCSFSTFSIYHIHGPFYHAPLYFRRKAL